MRASSGAFQWAFFSLMMLSCHAFSSLAVDPWPDTIIEGQSSALDHPEGIAFTPAGDIAATANLFNNTVTFYKRVGDSGSVYETTPAFSIKGKKSKLNFPHDVSFSPDGSRLAVANRKGNSVTIYKRDPSKGIYHRIPVAEIKGEAAQILGPSSVRYSPVENLIAVANTQGRSITFYRYQGDDYEQTPCQVIDGASTNISLVNGLDFSCDGELLAATLIDTNRVLIFQKSENSGVFYSPKPLQILEGKETNFCCPHSVSFHPAKEFLAVSNAEGRKNINIFQRSSEGGFAKEPQLTLEVTEMYDESTLFLIDLMRKKGGCKGVAFSPDGAALAVTQNLTQDPLQVPFSASILLFYPVKTH